jgi:surface antigen
LVQLIRPGARAARPVLQLDGVISLNHKHDFKEYEMKPPITMALAALMASTLALADPPSHAPAYGYYKKPPIAQHYKGKSGVVYANDYGIESGRCNRDEIGAVIGGVTGAAIGSQVASPGNQMVGMVIGGALGAVLGHAIGDSMDDRDRACMGHALEIGKPGVPVVWRDDGHQYQFTPRGDAADGCRHATIVVDGHKPRDVLACPSGRRDWVFRN